MQKLLYTDNTTRETGMQQLLEAIKNDQKITVPWKDSTACMQIAGEMVFLGDTLLHNVKSRKFSNDYTAIGHLQRRQWKFLGIKTRVLGKMEATATVKNSCGDTKTINIIKEK